MMQLTKNRVAGTKILALGVLVAALMATMLLLVTKPVHASTTFTVNSTSDLGDLDSGNGSCFTGDLIPGGGGGLEDECTLRAAIQEANETPGADTINFDIPGTGVATISPASELPEITDPVTIDGYSQPGAKPNTLALGNNAVLKIELSGHSTGLYASGLRISAANSTVKGLVINRWVIGIGISGSGTRGNKVMGNYVGTDASGTQDLGNSYYGVYLGAPDNTVGGATTAARNVISGNDVFGVVIQGAAAKGNKVTGNYVGTDASGKGDLGNDYGVLVYDAPNNTIGGTTAGARNVLSGNIYGVTISGAIGSAKATGNKVLGNYVGTDASGTKSLGNDYGVVIADMPNNTIGGTTARARNVISANEQDGVAISGAGATGNRILSNSIYSNGGLGIDLLGGDGVTPNDPGDADTGPNNLQNFPVLTSAGTSGGRTTIRGNLNSTPNKTFIVQFFSNPADTNKGKKFIGQNKVTTNSNGNVSFTFSPANKVKVGQNITATATSKSTGDTSEFSASRKVVAR